MKGADLISSVMERASSFWDGFVSNNAVLAKIDGGSSTTFDSIALGSKASMLDLADINFATSKIPQYAVTDGPNAIIAAEGDGFMYGGADSFAFGAGFGHDTITQFGDSTDQGLLDSSAAIFANLAAVKAATELAGTELHVDAGAPSSVAFIDTIMANLGVDDFRFY